MKNAHKHIVISILLTAITAFSSIASAISPCIPTDAAGTWKVYTKFNYSSKTYAASCTLVVPSSIIIGNSTSTPLDSSSCLLYNGSSSTPLYTVPVTGNIKVTSSCEVSGTLVVTPTYTKQFTAALSGDALNGRKNSVSGVAWSSIDSEILSGVKM